MKLFVILLVLVLVLGWLARKGTPPAPQDDEFQPFENEEPWDDPDHKP